MQLRISKTINFFEKMLRNKFNFEEYKSREDPALFFGIYKDNDFKIAQRHTGKKIIWFAGTDSTYKNLLVLMRDDPAFKDAVFIAESKWIEKDLDDVGIKYESISLFIDNLYNWKVEPLGGSLFWYGMNNSKYGKKYRDEIQKAIPDLNIISLDQGNVSRDEMPDIYKQCFAGIRPVEHDGMSLTVGEMGLMGRMSIYNGGGPFSVPYEGVQGIIEAIKGLREGYNPKVISKRTRGYFLDNEAKWTELVLRYCGLSEVDYTPTFDEIPDRCGSIFRIQRTSDIKKIGGLGDSQYQRPWLSEQMKKLGKKQLLVSKLSGYMSGEWKNIDARKGFPEGVDFNTKDRGTV